MKVQRIWAIAIGTVSLIVGILRFVIPSLGEQITAAEGIMHIIAAVLFYSGVRLAQGKFISFTNLGAGIIFVVAGTVTLNWAHIIIGTISVVMSCVILTHEGFSLGERGLE